MVKDQNKLKALESALAQIEKQYGKGSVMKLGDTSAHMNIETIPTGSISLDIALGLGGIPKGRIIDQKSSIFLKTFYISCHSGFQDRSCWLPIPLG